MSRGVARVGGGDRGTALVELPARVMASLVRSGETSAVELLDAHLARLDALEGVVRAFLSVDAEAAHVEAAEVDAALARGEDPGPLAGVPIALKDALCTRGRPTTCASRVLEGWCPPYDATVVARLRRRGAVLVGKTNMDEFAMGSSTENSAFFPTRNPWDLGRVPGGSSGGSAAAVAARFVPLALGSDTGGSIRQPAALCGVVGVKPTYGRVSRYGLVAYASSLDQVGPLARDVTDAALALEAIWGHDPADSTSVKTPPVSLLAGLERGVSGLRVGLVAELAGPEGLQPEVAAALARAADLLEAEGASVEVVSIPSVAHALSAYYLIAPAEASSNLARYDGVRYGLRVDGPDVATMSSRTRSRGFGAEVKRRIMLGTYVLSAGYYEAYYAKAQRIRSMLMADFGRAYVRFDALLSPTSPTTAFALGEKTGDPLSMYLSDVCTIPANLTGAPAMSLPSGLDASGLPIGVQVLAAPLGEAVMFRVARVLERGFSFGFEPALGSAPEPSPAR